MIARLSGNFNRRQAMNKLQLKAFELLTTVACARIKALAKNMEGGAHTNAVLASVTVLAVDWAGRGGLDIAKDTHIAEHTQ